jgi:hypothetical protein
VYGERTSGKQTSLAFFQNSIFLYYCDQREYHNIRYESFRCFLHSNAHFAELTLFKFVIVQCRRKRKCSDWMEESILCPFKGHLFLPVRFVCV